MAQSSDQVKSSTDLRPPDERFWQRYSPHHEALLSGVGSLTVHGLVVGIMILLGWAALWARTSETQRPPNMDVLQLAEGAEGGGEPAPLGQGEENTKQEAVAANSNPQSEHTTKEILPMDLPKTLVSPDAIADDPTPSQKDDVGAFLETIGQEAKKVQAVKVKADKPAGRKDGQVGKKGLGGSGGGTGTGIGKGKGPGKGGGGGTGQHKVYANRWNFNPAGNGREQAEKLVAARMILVVPHPSGPFVIRDLRRRPAPLIRENVAKLLDGAVYWVSRAPAEVAKLAAELRLSAAPPFLIILVPEDREQQMAAAEAEYAKMQGRPYDTITETWFDFRLRNGIYEPVVISQK